jgi:hypothetical protein
MNAPEEVQIERAIGPRLQRGAAIIETLTPFGQGRGDCRPPRP